MENADKTDPEMVAMGDSPITFGDEDGNEKTAAISLEELGIVSPLKPTDPDSIQDEEEAERTMALPIEQIRPQAIESLANENVEEEAERTMALPGPLVEPPKVEASPSVQSKPEAEAPERTMAMPSPSSSVEIDPSLEIKVETRSPNVQPPPLPIEANDDDALEHAQAMGNATKAPHNPFVAQSLANSSSETIAKSSYHRSSRPSPPDSVQSPSPIRSHSKPSFSGSDAAEGRTMMFDVSMLHSAASDEPQGVLTVIQGPDEGKEYFLRGPTVVVGRSLECDLTLNDASISRKHFRIERRDSEYIIVDMGSGNGTLVHGAPVTRCPLKESTTISVGTTVIRFNMVGSQERAGGSSSNNAAGTSNLGVIALWSGAIIFLLALIAGATVAGFHWGWWGAQPNSDHETIESDTTNKERMLDELYDLISDKDLDGADSLLIEIQEQYGDDEVLDSIATILDAAEEHEQILLKEKKKLESEEITVKKGHKILRALESIPTESPYHSEATRIADRTKNKMVEILKEQAYGLQTQGKYKEALDQIKQVLKFKPEDSEAEYHQEQLEAAIGEKTALNLPPTEPQPETNKKIDTNTPKTTEKNKVDEPKDTAPKTNTAPRPPNLRSGFRLYANGQFNEAARYFERIGKDRKYSKRIQKKCSGLATKIRSFSEQYNSGKSSGSIRSLEKARTLDRKINSTYKSEIEHLLAKAYTNKAVQAYSKKQYKSASSNARKALSYDSSQAKAKTIRDKVQNQAETNLSRARDAINRGDYAAAKRLLKQAQAIGGKGSIAHKKAARMLNQIRAEEALDDDD